MNLKAQYLARQIRGAVRGMLSVAKHDKGLSEAQAAEFLTLLLDDLSDLVKELENATE